MIQLPLILSASLIGAYLLIKMHSSSSQPKENKDLLYKTWSENFSLEIVNRLIGFLFVQILGFTFAVEKSDKTLTYWLVQIILSIVILDFMFYWRHRLYHRFGRSFHSTHHARKEFNLLMTLRIHPIETLIHVPLFYFFVRLSGLSQNQVLVVSLVFTFQAFFSHLELKALPGKLESWLSQFFVVPLSHVRHHEGNGETHFGFLLSVWDKIFKTHKEENFHGR